MAKAYLEGPPKAVIPAQAGIHLDLDESKMDPGLRRDDEQKPVSTRLGDVASFRNGLNFTKNDRGAGCPYVGIPDFSTQGALDYSRLAQINAEGIASHEDYLRSGDIVFVRSNGNKELVGRSIYIPSDVPALFSGFCIRTRVDAARVLPLFVYYFSKSSGFRKQLSGTGGSNINNLNQTVLSDVKLPKQSLAEQKKIVAVLSILDAKIDLNRRINAELEALAQTIYDYWFVQFDFPDARGRPWKSSGGAMVWNDTLKREIPAGWAAGSLDDLGQIVGGSTPSTANTDHFGHGMIPWITPKDLSNNKGNKFIARGETDVSEAGRRSASLTLYPAGTVLMSSRAPVGYLAIALNPVTTNQGFKSFVPSKGYGTSFVYYAVERSLPTIVQYASGSTFVEISAGVLKSVHATLPDKAVTSAFCDLIESIVKRQQQAELQSLELTRLRDWLLPLLMNGQVRVA